MCYFPVCGSAEVSANSLKTEGAPVPSDFPWRDFSQPNNKVLGFGQNKSEPHKTSTPKKLGKVDGSDDIGVAQLRSISSQSASSQSSLPAEHYATIASDYQSQIDESAKNTVYVTTLPQ